MNYELSLYHILPVIQGHYAKSMCINGILSGVINSGF